MDCREQRNPGNHRYSWQLHPVRSGVVFLYQRTASATARIPGVLDDLAAFVARVETIPGTVYARLVRNASFREEQLCNLFYLNTMDSGALESVEVLERWTAHLLDRKSMVRAALARRLSAVLSATISF